ncbi:Putative transcriptional regulator [Marinobacter nitratireducens]|uniref:Transcriptional regulator n=1 Tax=Marinobacter nitratireducens TaxID=1137280 RepID=A0A072N514_9GAMM|nr:nuclear transport factor 2 family protein [Marinobacter nitratireducens]KEF32372.1 Putative transcriptional regulator [Marinobacter nitratireducens]TNE94151.1 MAG: nuclear transport factor 2 family protein [Gammaproteobacteria bacterium]
MTTASNIEIGSFESAVPATLERFRKLFNELDRGNLNRLPEVYGENIEFKDPLGGATGLDELTHYFAHAYANAISCRFEFGDAIVNGPYAAIPWVMTLRHKRIRAGREIQVDGISQLKIDQGRVVYHRDFFDAGQLLYENLPVVGRVVRWVKGYAG